MVVDFHTHAFPEKIAGKALELLSKKSGNMVPFTDGTAQGLLSHMDSRGVDKAVVLGIATNPAQQRNVNDFAASLAGERLIPFGSIHPDAPDAVEELYRISQIGLKGIKFHPEYQDFFVDEDRMLPLYETCDKLGLIVTFHAGADVGYPEPVHNTPERLASILPVFKKGRVVAAHFGGYALWSEVGRCLAGKNIYFDTGFCYSRMPCPYAAEIIKSHGYKKVLFGSDLPWSDERLEQRFVEGFGLDEEQTAAVLGKNAAELLGI